MISRLVKMTFKSENIEKFKAVFEDSKDLIRAFPGNHHVELLNDVRDPRIFFTFSLWESEEALDKYRHSELFETTWAKTKVLFDDRPQAWSTEKLAEGQL